MTEPPPPHIPFIEHASYPARPGNRVRPLIDGEPAFRRICEAVEAARYSVWVTVAFIRSGCLMPDGRNIFFDVLDEAVARGLDVRVLFWRPNSEATYVGAGTTFSGTEDRDFLERRRSRFRVRWDRAHGAFCQHQKSWLIDAGELSETAFIGGLNINPRAMASPGHEGGGGFHDAYVEIAGPSATDVHHNFAQRWNEASERAADDGVWGHSGQDNLAFPERLSQEQGASLVQIQRNIDAGLYRDGRPSPAAPSFEIANGESTIREQYLAAIDAAHRSIYIENQALSVDIVFAGLKRAIERGVETVVLLPAEPDGWIGAARRRPENKGFFGMLADLDHYENFTLAGIASLDTSGLRKNIYVHAKLMLVDDAWATIGSCNLHRNSLFGHSELNASFWAPEIARGLRCELLAEHLGHDTAHLDNRAALRLYREVAITNRGRQDVGQSRWQGLAFKMDPRLYGA
jgi:phosphatidylserine/phosphatidylglycerophosphate/cardiolipin synthase-like enzyme